MDSTMRRSKGLRTFVRDECANYTKHDETCLFSDSCKVMDGRRCDYLEKAVLGPPDYKYKLPGYDYGKLFAQYAEQTKAEKQRVSVRHCGCGTPLQHRRRYCDNCARRTAKKANRARQKKHRLQLVST